MAKTKLSKKGIIIIIVSVIVLTIIVAALVFVIKRSAGKTPVDLTLEFMNKYKNASSEVMKEVNYPFEEELTNTQKERYKEIIKSQYLALKYEITDETVGEIDAIIKVEFEVLDYKSSHDKAISYLQLYEKDLSKEKQMDYVLKQISNTKEKTRYSIEFNYYKLDDKWEMINLTKADYNKLAGTF